MGQRRAVGGSRPAGGVAPEQRRRGLAVARPTSGRRAKPGETERILVPAGEAALTLEKLERTCLVPLARLLSDAAVWRSDGYGDSWKIGDYRFLIVETTVGPDAVLYVQFWSEPLQPVQWEVSSGHRNPAAKPFITEEARRRLSAMGFEIAGSAQNFRKFVPIGNRGDAAAIAREALRIFHDALGYRGATPLVARLVRGERARRAIVHTRLMSSDVATLLTHIGYDTRVERRAERTTVFGHRDGFRFGVMLDTPAEDVGFQCLDLVTIVGSTSEGGTAPWFTAINGLNSNSRVARAWVDDAGDVYVGTSVMCRQGVTEAYLCEQIAAWHNAATSLPAAVAKARRREQRKRKRARSPEQTEATRTKDAGEVVH